MPNCIGLSLCIVMRMAGAGLGRVKGLFMRGGKDDTRAVFGLKSEANLGEPKSEAIVGAVKKAVL